jgi:4a-hydroxytetrahydrobiopterin dehydratase
MALLSRDDIASALRDLPGWRTDHLAIVKEFTFAGFPEAVAFVTRLVPGSEAADHHPDLAVSYRRVTVAFTTHSEGGVTAKDIAGARMADSCA